ncbi:MAG: DUF1211 domain-containing protein [Salinibacterium sp.]|nr:DUF1211 domain-containing protein [Salinibacterium sp.]
MTTYQRYVRTIAEGSAIERLVFFSDAVFAIAMTLLVVELHVPTVAAEDLASALAELGPEYLSFVLSFAVIGAVWMSHHRKFRVIVRYSQALLRLNLFMLLAVASVPFSTAVLGRYGDVQLSVYIYAASICLIGFLLSAMWIYAWHSHLIDPDVPVDVFRYVLVQSFPIPGIFLLSIPIAALAGATAAEITWAAALPISFTITRVYRARV